MEVRRTGSCKRLRHAERQLIARRVNAERSAAGTRQAKVQVEKLGVGRIVIGLPKPDGDQYIRGTADRVGRRLAMRQ